MSNDDLDALVRARALILDKAAWTQRESCRDDKGIPHLAGYSKATQFCAYGALAHVTGANMSQPGWNALYEACGGSPIDFNDGHTHAEVLAAFDRAIDIARKTPMAP